MNKFKTKSSVMVFALTAVIFPLILIGGCSDDNTTDSAINNLLTVNSDICESVASSIALDNGGVLDQLADLAIIATESDSLVVGKTSTLFDGPPVYDSITGMWRVQVSRQRGYATEPFQAMFTRTYTYQYRNQNGEPQERWVVGADTAYSIQFGISNGSGYCRTLRLSHRLTNMYANWVITGVNTDTITINGTYERAGTDTLKTSQYTRTLQHQLTLTLTNVRCIRGSAVDFAQQVKGALSGSYTANIMFMGGNAYGETFVNRNMNIALGDGQATFMIESESFTRNLETGEPIEG